MKVIGRFANNCSHEKAMKTATKTRVQRRRIAQGDYEKFMKDSSDKCAEESKLMNDEETALAEPQEGLVNDKKAFKNKNTDLMNTDKTLSDWRTGEIDAMGKARDVPDGHTKLSERAA